MAHSRPAAAALALELANNAPSVPAAPSAATKENNVPESLFGPNIGIVSNGPIWTAINEKKVLADELTQETVKTWIEKSKEANQPTTTLQALVNLKRPTIRLSPLSSPEDPEQPHSQSHGLEFEYDCDAPKCGIYVHVLLPATHPAAASVPAASVNSLGDVKLLVFETVVQGGFGRMLKLEEGAILDLGGFEMGLTTGPPSTPEPPSAPSATLAVPNSEEPANNRTSRRRFTSHFNFRRRTGSHNQNRSVAGPALAVVDAAESNANSNPDSKNSKKEENPDEGVRAVLRLVALDEQGTELVSPNEQVTYLHVVRFGAKVAAEGAEGEDEEDTRPWVVKVVKREATIGPHTFHLHEIYGLTSSSSTNTHAPTAPLPSPNAYPPSSPTVAVPPPDEEDPASALSECLVCLSSPREVVLLPCRHLVACKECALNMVEFGAGGNITHAEEPTSATAATDGQNEAGAEGINPTDGANDTATTPVTATNPAPRRKRKAKGWFCPVCRQPYTSLLRITTAPPPIGEKKLETSITMPLPAVTHENGTNAEETRGGGLLSNAFRPNFLRNFSANANATPAVATRGNGGPMGDLESQSGLQAMRPAT